MPVPDFSSPLITKCRAVDLTISTFLLIVVGSRIQKAIMNTYSIAAICSVSGILEEPTTSTSVSSSLHQYVVGLARVESIGFPGW